MRPYDGGKSGSGTYQQIINHIPPHDIYIEPFAGHCGIFRKIRACSIAVLNDTDADVIDEIYLHLAKRKDIEVVRDFMQGNLFEKPTKQIVIIRNNDYSVMLERFGKNPNTFIYCDPPYPMSCRSSQARLYTFDWESDIQHIHFLKAANLCECKMMISTYPNDLYQQALSGWHKHEFYAIKRNHKKALEVIYMNYPPPTVLHDYQYLGGNFRQRERIKRKVTRTISRLNKLPPAERMAIFSAMIAEYKTTVETLIKL